MKTKSIIKRSLAALLVLLTLLSSGVANIFAATVELAETGETYTIYYYNKDNWSNVYCYAWSPENQGWPGKPMTKVGNTKIYSYSSSTAYPNAIFNNNSGLQTSDLNNITWGKMYSNGKWVDFERTLYVDVTGKSVTNMYCYAWAPFDNNVNNGNYPGVSMTKVSDNIYSVTIYGFYENCIFNNNTNTVKSDDLDIPNNGTNLYSFSTDSWSTYNPGPDAPTGLTVNSFNADKKSGTGTTDDPYRIPVGMDFTVDLTVEGTAYDKFVWSADSDNNDWDKAASDVAATTTTNSFVFDGIDEPDEYYIEFSVDSKNTSGTVSGSPQTKKIYVETYDYFRAGDVVYFENNSNDTGSYTYAPSSWTGDIYVNITGVAGVGDGTINVDDTNGKPTTKLGDYLYTYTFDAADEAKYIESVDFLRVVNGVMWCYTDEQISKASLATANTVVLSGFNNGDRACASELTTISSMSLVPVLDVPAEVTAGESVTLSCSSVTLKYTLGSDQKTTPANTDLVTYTYTASGNGTLAGNVWTPANDTVNNLTVSLGVDATLKVGDKQYAAGVDRGDTVTVLPAGTRHTITLPEVITGGTVTVTPSKVVLDGATVTLKAEADTGYEFKEWQIDGVYDEIDTATLTSTEITITPRENLTVTPVFTVNTGTVEFIANIGGSVSNSGYNNVTYPDSKSSTATSAEGYHFTGWTISGGTLGTDYEISEGNTNEQTIGIKPLVKDAHIKVTANFEINTYTVEFVDHEGDVLKSEEVQHGKSATPPAEVPTREHYTFSGWDTDYTSITGETTVKAQYTGNTYTVTMVQVENGTATAVPETVTYPETVTLSAQADENYMFTKWVIEGAHSISGEGTLNSSNLTIIPEADITITPTFVDGMKLTVHSYSEDGYDKLTLKENGTTTLDAVQPNTSTFNGVEWKTSNEKELDSTTTNITAMLSGEGGIPVGNGTLIMFNNTLGWSNVYVYNSATTLYCKDNGGDINHDAISTTGLTGTLMTEIGDTNIYYAYVTGSVNYIAFLRDERNGHNWVYNSAASYPDKGTVTGEFSDSTPVFVPTGGTANWDQNSTKYYNDGKWESYTATSTDSGDIDLTDALFDNGAWLGNNEVWIYQNGTSSTVTVRRELLDLIERVESAYNDGDKNGYTEETYTPFKAAYETALANSGAAATDQVTINSNYDTLLETFNALRFARTATVTVKQTAVAGTVTIGSINFTQIEETNSNVVYGTATSLTVKAPVGYYVVNVTVNGAPAYTGSLESFTEYLGTCIFTSENGTGTVNVTYAPRTPYTITVGAFNNNGTLSYTVNNGEAETVTANGDTITVYSGDTVKFTPVANDNYEFLSWTVDNKAATVAEYTFANISANHSITVLWAEKQTFNVTIQGLPNSVATLTATAGSDSVTNTKDQNKLTVEKGTIVTLTATNINGCYEFNGWVVSGKYIVEEGKRTDKTFIIKANSDLEITANFTKLYKKIYLELHDNWTTPMWCHDGNPSVGWGESKTLTLKETKDTYKLYEGYVAMDTTWIKFSDNKSDNKAHQFNSIGNNNYFIINGSSYTAKEDNPDTGFYLRGEWNDKTVTNNSVPLYDNINGEYVTTINVTETEDGYIYLYPVNHEGTAYWAASANNTTNGQVLATNNSENNKVKIEINTYNYNDEWTVTVYFNPDTGEFRWDTYDVPAKAQVYATDGRKTNEADSLMVSSNGRVGDTYFDFETVLSYSEHTYYTEAKAELNKPVTIYTQVNPTTAGKYEYYVAGWVVNGTEFLEAREMGNGLYSASYVFKKEDTYRLTPVYFHTQEWLDANDVSVVTVYAVNHNNSISNWDDYMSAYTWYKQNGTTKYQQFGTYTGQFMIPVQGLDHVYYTYIETTSPDGITVSGITFNNHGEGNNNGYDVSHETPYGSTTNTHIQTYDYYEFISLLEDGKQNITFVLKNMNDDYNGDRVGTGSVNKSDFEFEQLTDYSGLKIDIYNNNIESIDENLTEADALYIIQTGNHSTTTAPLSGQWYVKSRLYRQNPNNADQLLYLGECYSYLLHDRDSDILETLTGYTNQRVYISYEDVSDDRYDGEWYGDANVEVKVNLAVQVALMNEDETTWTPDTEGEINKAAYGEAYINVTEQNADVIRGKQANITAKPLSGYRFVGWATADGTIFTTNVNYTVTAGAGTKYTAVFERLSEGVFYVNHYIYNGTGTASYVPKANGGHGLLYVGVENISKDNLKDEFAMKDTASVAATAGDKLRITIGTDPLGADKFYAWYVDAVDKDLKTTYEEVGVDSYTNQYDNNGTVVGRNDMVYFQFEYEVQQNDSFSLTLYSDMVPVSVNATLKYFYYDRFGKTKEYYVPYKLSDQEIEGFAGNNYQEYTPAYISGDGWVNAILANAPYVEDFYNDTTWSMKIFDNLNFELWATQPATKYTVTFSDGEDREVKTAYFNELVVYEAKSGRGFWYNELSGDNQYTEGVDLIVAYTPRYALRVTKDLNLVYQTKADEYDFNVTLDDPVYGRYQTTDKDGNNKTDKIQIDYITNILTPYFYGEDTQFTPWYDGKEVSENWDGSQVTVESLVKAGYTVEYGLVAEQCASVTVSKMEEYDAAVETAKGKGYGTATNKSVIEKAINNGYNGNTEDVNVGDNTVKHAFYVYNNTNTYKLTNMNRYQFYFELNNTASYWKRFYNVYAYVKVTTPESEGSVTTTYISNVQTLNTFVAGQMAPVVSDTVNA